MNDKRRHYFAIGLTACWLLAVIAGFWWFSARFIMPFSETLVNFDGAKLQTLAPAGDGTLTVVGVFDSTCPCAATAQSHWQDLQQRFPNTRFIDAKSSEAWHFLSTEVLSTPAVTVWNGKGDLIYFGPFSSGAFCGSGSDFVAMALEAVALDEYFYWINQDAVGCFCQQS